MKRILVITTLLSMIFGFAAFQCSSSELTSARLYIQQENYDKAKEVLLQEVATNPASSEGYYLLGYLEGQEGNYDKMVEYYDSSLAIDNKYQEDINNSKFTYWANNFNRGVKAYNMAADATSPDSTKFYFSEAIENFENSIMVEPDSLGAYQNLASAYINSGRSEEAIKPLEKLFERKESASGDTLDANVYLLISRLYVDKGDKISSTDSLAAVDQYVNALKYLEEGNTYYPANSDLTNTLLSVYIKANRFEEAEEKFSAKVKNDPTNKFNHYAYGVFLYQAQKFDEAKVQFEQALEIDPQFLPALRWAAENYINWGNHEKQKVEEEESSDTAYLEKFRTALQYLEKYVQIDSEDAIVWERLGQVYAFLGESEKSMEAYDKADTLK